jgi:ADP-ribose pyrophosphatase YjhB (NUDIX family)
MQKNISKYPSPYYRASIKAIIRNDKNEVLVCKEKGQRGAWNLPGGGMDHGETIEQALKREMYEEALITASFTALAVGAQPMYLSSHQAWQLWVVYELTLEKGYTYGAGVDADEVAFIDPKTLKDSSLRSERLVYKWCVDRTAAF